MRACAFLHLYVVIRQYLCLTLVAGEKQPPEAGERNMPYQHCLEGACAGRSLTSTRAGGLGLDTRWLLWW